MLVRLGVVHDVHLSSLHMIKKKHLFEESDIQVEIKEFAGGTGELSTALSKGDVDLGIGLTDGFITAITRGSAFRNYRA